MTLGCVAFHWSFEPTVVLTAYIRLVQAQGRQNHGMDPRGVCVKSKLQWRSYWPGMADREEEVVFFKGLS